MGWVFCFFLIRAWLDFGWDLGREEGEARWRLTTALSGTLSTSESSKMRVRSPVGEWEISSKLRTRGTSKRENLCCILGEKASALVITGFWYCTFHCITHRSRKPSRTGNESFQYCSIFISQGCPRVYIPEFPLSETCAHQPLRRKTILPPPSDSDALQAPAKSLRKNA